MKLKMLENSTCCLTLGLLSFIPVLGFPFAIAALWISGRVRLMEKLHWNAAGRYRIVGTLCAAITSIAWFFLISLIIYHIASSDSGSGRGFSGDE
ncbi:MAG: hypothetical protein JF609_04850 [Verrucomicrobia bacterium]|nr:hypothetical protein [Verrucomicrobiota bacterium]